MADECSGHVGLLKKYTVHFYPTVELNFSFFNFEKSVKKNHWEQKNRKKQKKGNMLHFKKEGRTQVLMQIYALRSYFWLCIRLSTEVIPLTDNTKFSAEINIFIPLYLYISSVFILPMNVQANSAPACQRACEIESEFLCRSYLYLGPPGGQSCAYRIYIS